MADISYTPRFTHELWQDNVDRVEAGGDNGFNKRFTTIENDLIDVSTVVGQIDTAIDQLEAKVSPTTVTLSFTPALLPVQSVVGTWKLKQNSASAVVEGTNAPIGIMALTVPDGVRITHITVRGAGVPQAGAPPSSFQLTRVALITGVHEHLVSFNTGDVPLNTKHPVPSDKSLVDLTNFRYVITAGSSAASSDPVTLFAFQLTCVQPS